MTRESIALDAFTVAYIEAALWSSTYETEDREDNPMDDGEHELADETRDKMIADCEQFQAENADLLSQWYESCGESIERAGHDFWLTRNRHGAGYWDRSNDGTPEGKIGRALTDAAHAFGSVDLYIGDDGLIYS